MHEMPAVSRRSKQIAIERFPDITWLHSHVTSSIADGAKYSVVEFASRLPADESQEAVDLVLALQPVQTEHKGGLSNLRLAPRFWLVLVTHLPICLRQPYLGQPSALTSLSGSGLMFFTAGGMVWLAAGTR